MNNRRIFIAMVCSIFLLGGCGNQEAGAEREESQQSQVTADDSASVQTLDEMSDSGDENKVVIETGPDKKLYEDGEIHYVLHDFQLYNTPEEASVKVVSSNL